MFALLCFVLAVLVSPFKSKSRLEAENAALRHQLIVLRRKVHRRVRLTDSESLVLDPAVSMVPSILRVLTIVQPETLVRWHRAGFRRFWRWKSRSRGGRPQFEPNLRVLIRRMSIENPRVHRRRTLRSPHRHRSPMCLLVWLMSCHHQETVRSRAELS
jgi:hypothetical protein